MGIFKKSNPETNGSVSQISSSEVASTKGSRRMADKLAVRNGLRIPGESSVSREDVLRGHRIYGSGDQVPIEVMQSRIEGGQEKEDGSWFNRGAEGTVPCDAVGSKRENPNTRRGTKKWWG